MIPPLVLMVVVREIVLCSVARFLIAGILPNCPEFAAFSIDLCNSGTPGFVAQIPKVYGLHQSDEAWMTNMRLRLAICPANLLNYSICSCGANGVFRHLINFRYFIHLRAVIHDGLRDSCYSMFTAHGFHSKVEPVLNQ
ncbi:hypothetical protein GEMRC1_009520 [Eukaryota sp. GEM-RC1]